MKQKISVLCAVRDDSVVKALMREMDDGEYCVFSIVKSGTQALCAAQRKVPDVLIADAILPGLDGPALADRLRESLRAQTLRVIGGAMLPFAREAFERRGVNRIVGVPWDYAQLRGAMLEAFEEIDSQIDWSILQEGRDRAAHLLSMLGMNSALRGYEYLAWAAALAALRESRLRAIGEQIYAPIAKKHNTTPQNVERLIRHAVESTMDAIGAEELYAFFGNTIDPMRGKPTNVQIIAMLAQKVRVESA